MSEPVCLHDVCNGWQAIRHYADLETVIKCLMDRGILNEKFERIRNDSGPAIMGAGSSALQEIQN